MIQQVKTQLGGKDLIIETGKIAKQASGAVTVRYGDTVVLVAVTSTKEPIADKGFTPITVDYRERTYAAGKIPGGFFKREGKPSDHETLTSRLIDRPIRPLFPDGFLHDTQIVGVTLSADEKNSADTLAITAASAALMISPVQFLGPIAGVRVGRLDGKLVINPTMDTWDKLDFNIIVAGSKDGVVMVEGGAKVIPEKDLLEAITFAHKELQVLIKLQLDLAKLSGKTKWADPITHNTKDFEKEISSKFDKDILAALAISDKLPRYEKLSELKTKVILEIGGEEADADRINLVSIAFSNRKRDLMRNQIVNESKRIGGRSFTEVRQIASETSVLPRTHGSALFTRGETQVLATATLGTKDDEQTIDNISGEYNKRFLLHYNFPPFSVGEVKPMRGPGRREIGHGTLAERSLTPVLPTEEEFPYTIRIVSEVMESNGSSSMATVCASSLALMDAGVPMKDAVAGVAMGLIEEGNKTIILTDILGDEDHLGDMDFKVAGTKSGVTAIQMDIKVEKLDYETLSKALEQARVARLHILERMSETMGKHRDELSQYAPKLTVLKIPTDKIGDLIGPGGKNIRAIIAETGATIDIDDDGTVHIAATDQEAGEKAIKAVKKYTMVPEVGKYYRGKVNRIAEFGAFVEILPKTDGLVHISQLANERVKNVKDVVKEGDVIVVKVIEIDAETGKIRLSLKQAIGHENEVEAS